jgi:hypothetical protein
MFQSLLTALSAGLTLWSSKEKTKYQDHIIKLRTEWHEEYSKSPEDRSDAVLDDIEFRLQCLCSSFSIAVGATNPKN